MSRLQEAAIGALGALLVVATVASGALRLYTK